MSRYRFTYRGQPVGPWRGTRREAAQDAVDVGEATQDEHQKDRIYLAPFAEIEAEYR